MFLRVLAVVLLCLFPASAVAKDMDAVFTMSVPQELVAWIQVKTGIKLPTAPKIVVVNNDAPLFYGEDALHALGDAAYLNGTIYFPIRSIVHFQEPTYQALTVHELVHATQDHNGRAYACTGQREAEAYNYQNQYLTEHGQFPAISAEEIAAMNACEGRYRP